MRYAQGFLCYIKKINNNEEAQPVKPWMLNAIIFLLSACADVQDISEDVSASSTDGGNTRFDLPKIIEQDTSVNEYDSSTEISYAVNTCDGCYHGCEVCDVEHCVKNHEGYDICTRLCAPGADDCGPGWECQVINNSGADATWLCIPREMPLCKPCESNSDCGPGNVCLDTYDGQFCGASCLDGFCPDGSKRFFCDDSNFQCTLMEGESCLNCIDLDHDGYGIGDGCLGPDCNDSNIAININAKEFCDGLDNDCNGYVDDFTNIEIDGNLIDCINIGVCADSNIRCQNGEWTCVYPLNYENGDEISCDNLDNNCDGLVDNIPGRGEECTSGFGACESNGTLICDGISGELICNAVPLNPVSEICNGIDDDCDQIIDNVSGYGEQCDVGFGECRRFGEMLCDTVIFQLRCSAQPSLPQNEICDNRDNDCDGQVDEDLENCHPEPSNEICNSIDDDFDGLIDEDLSRACPGNGCGEGIQYCNMGQWGECQVNQGDREEICNGLDDDCDGQIDEELSRPCQGGACGNGVQVCNLGNWGACDSEIRDEVCNGIDDDCNGQIDDGLTRECDGNECGPGLQECLNGQWSSCNPNREPFPEICNRIDDNCNGQIDEGEVCGVCSNQPDNWVIQNGDWSNCIDFSNECDETGTRSRQNQVCVNEEIAVNVETEACNRDTDGNLVNTGNWSICSQFSNVCDESGIRSRQNQVCVNGQIQLDTENEVCNRDTDGAIIDVGNWGVCSQFSNECDETGLRTKYDTVCQNGIPVENETSEVCRRDTDGQTIEFGSYGDCESQNRCSEIGSRTRINIVCRDGNQVQEEENPVSCVPNIPEREDQNDFIDENCDNIADLEFLVEIRRFIHRCNWSSWQSHNNAVEGDVACAPDESNPMAGCTGCNNTPPNNGCNQATCWGTPRSHYVYVRPVDGYANIMGLMRHCYKSSTGSNRYTWLNSCASIPGGGYLNAYPSNLYYYFKSNPNVRPDGLRVVPLYQCEWQYEPGKLDYFFTMGTEECDPLNGSRYINPLNDSPQNSPVIYAYAMQFD